MVVSFLSLVAGFISVALAAIVIAEGTNTKSMRLAYGMFAGSVGLWAIFLGLFLVLPAGPVAELSVYLYYSLGVLIPYAFLLFSLAYLSIPTSLRVRLFALLPWILMTVLIVSPDVMMTGIDATAKTVELVFSTYLVYSAVFVLYVAIGLWLLITKAARARGKLAHRRIVAVSLFIGFAGGGFFDIILPLVGNYSLIAYGPLFAFVTSAGIFYVIARHRLFDVRFTVVRTVNYVLTLSTLGVLYLVIAYFVLNLLLGQSTQSSQLFLNLGITILLVLFFQPVKLFFDRWTNYFFYRYTYSTDEVFANLNRILAGSIDLHTLLDQVVTYLAKTLKARDMSIVVNGANKRIVQAGTAGHKRLAAEDVRWLSEYVAEHERPSALRSFDANLDDTLRRFMASYRLDLIIPLVQKDTIIGYICLGEHQQSVYTKRDERLLGTISSELIIAIQNALSVQEVRNLNASLEQRIDAATKELRASNAQLQKLDIAKDEFISMASHQLRTPLTSIKGYISMIMEGDVGKVSPEQKHLLREAFIGSERMVRLIGDFLNVSRLQTGKFVIDKRPVDLGKLVARELEGLGPNAAARGLKFVYKRPKSVPLLNLDENKIQQVIMNFADNAIYYSKENATITVALKSTKEWVEFTVKDTGIGVPAAQQDELFSKFFRATNARQQRPDGTGVGLFLAKKVVDAHYGEVVFSSKENKGSTFGFRLPIARLQPAGNTDKLVDKQTKR
jgi:signal transduction histidine kinase